MAYGRLFRSVKQISDQKNQWRNVWNMRCPNNSSPLTLLLNQLLNYLFSEPYKSHIPPLEEMCGFWADLLNPAQGQFFTSKIITTTSFFSRSCFLTDAQKLFSSVVVMLSLFLCENSVVNKDFLASDAISFSFMLCTMPWWKKNQLLQTSDQNLIYLPKLNL